jgi:multisubunit Na+/H+ antiporter MnhG subunit
MIKWILVMAVVVILLGIFAPQLAKLGLWRLPGDLRFKRKGREYFLPITSTILVSVVLTLLLRLFGR